MSVYRTHTCGALRAENVGEDVVLSGWVHRKRDHGGLLFIDLRDHYGLTQILCEPEEPFFAEVEAVRAESVIRVHGRVVARDEAQANANLPTGAIEVRITKFEVLSAAGDLPLPVFGEPDYPEDIRMKHRYLDLRRETMHSNIMLRSRVISALRQGMEKRGFTEFQTPILTASSPEGARDFLVPSRLHPGRFFALPQAPQIFKQLIMVSGFDRYFQIAPCFRDEDARADRSAGEFYQLDVEMSFVTQEEVWDTTGPVVADVFDAFAGERKVDAYDSWPRIPYAESMLKYGTDKPDLRVPLEMQVVTEHFRGSGFKIFAQIAEDEAKQIRAIPAPGGGSRAFCDRMNSWAQRQGLPGMGYIMFDEGDGKGPLAKNIGPERTHAIREQLGLKAGDAAFFVAGKPAEFEAVAGRARVVVGEELDLIERDRFAFCWIVDFPMYEWDEDNKKVEFGHNPFSMPQGGIEALKAASTEEEKLALKANQYDLVCNGYEFASGAIRNHMPDLMYEAFAVAGYGREVVEEKFGGLLNAFRYGAPPHGGIAYGVDRIVMLLAEQENIREVTMFPLTQGAEDLLLGAPAEVSPQQLKDVHIRVAKGIKEMAAAPIDVKDA
ncbi:aspartate--tRNA ligase [Parvularcula dongshanensis]|uniref:Aspartate--tRNA(Asp/Asn) ligase n=1 Tax=Parvularcula dongshanensis TaxID=1173995 RepID=A0A840I0I8_9PROT|nr:aspartate--tRNA ligase [Parvularcula dongshanensis]MBB4657722.1 aspartyl-tRNA synthetase [Parvularcula dongshanensis]